MERQSAASEKPATRDTTSIRRLLVVATFAALCILFVANCVVWWLPMVAAPVLTLGPELLARNRA